MKKIAIYMGPAWEKWHPGVIENGGIGGSEGAIIQLAPKLVRYGYDVEVYGDVPSNITTKEGVKYIPHDSVDSIGTDILIMYRTVFPLTDFCKIPITYNKAIAWATDTVISEPPGGFDWNRLDQIWALSKWAADNMAKQQKMPKDKVYIVPLTADASLYQKMIKRHPFQAFYSSCPSRGLLRMLQWSEEIVKYVPDFKLAVCNNFTTIDGIIKQRGTPQLLEDMNKCKSLLHKPFVKYYGRLGHLDLSKVQRQSQIWMYGTHFEETYCITAQEAGLANNAILTSAIGCLPETVGCGGILLPGNPDTPEYKEQFIGEMVRLFNDSKYLRFWQERANQEMLAKPEWGQIAFLITKLLRD
jgi:glycosyltransferase involved in cell wall biosynthesis